MCGILGFWGEGSQADLRAMADALAHRGPDADGFLVDESLGLYLGHRRLSVIDLQGGVQPLSDISGRIDVTYNGEIYNHRDLRRELEAKGHRFVTDHSDTEVLIHGYKEWGDNLPSRLEGMFAFALHDRAEARLFLARDPFGKKPLYINRSPSGFRFASEVSALLVHPAVDPAPSRDGLLKLFAYNFIPAPLTAHAAIRKLPGGHQLSVSLRDGAVTETAYSRFSLDPIPPAGPAEERRLIEECRALLEQAVQVRLDSDVPLGLLLSGGIDSTAVLAFMHKINPDRPVDSFSIGFDESSFDESGPARRVADFFGTRHREELVGLGTLKGDLHGLLGRLDEPSGDSSILPTERVCRLARRHVTVALGGDGGDELFAGYDPMIALEPTHWLRRVLPGPAIGGLGTLARLLPRSDRNLSLDFKVRRWLRGAGLPEPYWLAAWMGALDLETLGRLFGITLRPEDVYSEALDVFDQAGSPDRIDRALAYFTRLYLQDDILMKGDRASMLNGLEVRSPLLDDRLAAFAARLPTNMKLRGRSRKWILREAIRDLVPADVLNRPKKGFGIPLSAWLRALPKPEAPAAALPFDTAYFGKLWDDHASGREDHRHALWCGLGVYSRFDRNG
ncbi:MAG: asparagine synthase (glutamine-hydrolyzing) [Rhodospirillales bacterium]